MFGIKITTDNDTLRDLSVADNNVRDGLKKALKKIAFMMEAEAKKGMGDAGKPQIRTGNLRRSVESGSGKLSAWVGSHLIYAGLQELGGTIKPRTADYLTFQIGRNWVKVRTVKIPARPYLEPAVKENLGKFSKIIQDCISDEVEKE